MAILAAPRSMRFAGLPAASSAGRPGQLGASLPVLRSKHDRQNFRHRQFVHGLW
jgi:hypothetical protein